ncbi:MAG TPA: YrhB domain-containing protein [Capsulimonadaceae bacterium]|jgi:hypothetical protein
MLTKDEARVIAQRFVSKATDEGIIEYIIVDSETIEKAYAWVFSYDSKLFLETEDFRYAIAGNGPLVVDKFSGHLFVLGSAGGRDNQLAEFEHNRGRYSPTEV